MNKAGMIVLICAALAACSDTSEVKQMNERISQLEAKVEDLTFKISMREFIDDAEDVAYLTPGDMGYSIIKTDLGKITVQISSIKSYANGSKVVLRFGNVTAADLNGVSAIVQWGRVDQKGSPDNDNQRSREITFTRSFRSGSWNNLEVILDGVPMAELGFVRVSKLSHKGIALRT